VIELQELAEELNDDGARAFACHMFAVQASLGPDPASALPHFRQALALYPPTVDPQHLDNLLVEMAATHALVGDSEVARELFDDLFRRCTDRGDRWLLSYALWGRAFLDLRDGHAYEAELQLFESLCIKRDFRETLGITLVCELLAWTAVAQNDASRAAELFGIADTFWGAVGFRQLKLERAPYESQARAYLGPAVFDELARRGAALGREAAINFALRQSASRTAATSDVAQVLTRRQREVAALVAEGLQNKEIATRLVISLRTAEGHVESILSKLGFTTRTQIASWVHEQERGVEP
jgi:non-specific serine/threonine protein kinase